MAGHVEEGCRLTLGDCVMLCVSRFLSCGHSFLPTRSPHLSHSRDRLCLGLPPQIPTFSKAQHVRLSALAVSESTDLRQNQYLVPQKFLPTMQITEGRMCIFVAAAPTVLHLSRFRLWLISPLALGARETYTTPRSGPVQSYRRAAFFPAPLAMAKRKTTGNARIGCWCSLEAGIEF